jgi:hypothetical protein
MIVIVVTILNVMIIIVFMVMPGITAIVGPVVIIETAPCGCKAQGEKQQSDYRIPDLHGSFLLSSCCCLRLQSPAPGLRAS